MLDPVRGADVDVASSVPVAPVTRPWRLASFSVRYSGLTLFPIRIVPSGEAAVVAVFVGLGDLEGAERTMSRRPFKELREL